MSAYGAIILTSRSEIAIDLQLPLGHLRKAAPTGNVNFS
jgi:hypothetical protein